ncbi:FKBP-type peptidyl-prolyl cis-trans isomerase [Flavobacterium muglaense]|uniref:FKBP-type peptidylprolyl isomerase n=1 Tax=Flavobacterium muglaense TaxID=2764716 RepID=A0A923N1A2_9FLAO|nr:FKBP-type peptidylprolyl isomerase [Flavobacterium muglaense]MBC5839587.1 FKBP-type peptidylprolyl isomerase [Flavobacterium muglaense]MBC5846123.1 FKBP-type peptidylprolyl isomerase [Flavobacterium muglaense]
MNKFRYYFILLITTVSLFSCSKSDTPEITPPREYSVQYATDLADIEEYLNNYYITVTNNPGAPDDQDVVFTKIPAGGTQDPIMSYKDKTTFPKLLSREVKLHDITYKLYYLVLREGVGESPSNVDEVYTTYRGEYLENKAVDGISTLTTTKFEEWKFEPQRANLIGYIRGWKEIFPQFKTGTYTSNSDGSISYSNFGAGVMFIPSGLAYYAAGNSSIPAYAPLIFTFKLYEIQRLDHEFNISNNTPTPDGILSYQEDLDGDGYMWTKGELPTGAVNPDDTDGDGIPNFLDVDDDADGIGTRKEISAADGTIIPFAIIPDCSGNTTNPARIKRHLVKCN